jgi:hypothetical protein
MRRGRKSGAVEKNLVGRGGEQERLMKTQWRGDLGRESGMPGGSERGRERGN